MEQEPEIKKCNEEVCFPCDDPFEKAFIRCQLPEGHEGFHVAHEKESNKGKTVQLIWG